MKTRKNLLIICEGESTEPNYFNGLRNRIIDLNIDYSITILPKPPVQKKTEEAMALENSGNGRRRRALKNVAVDESYMVEDEYKAQPTRYVREAQLGLIDGTFDESWAVYDLDGHADHQGAYLLAQQLVEDKKIHIGFSSISFEAWILWHFEANTKPFLKSQCRTGKELHECGKGTHAKDCRGNDCITGYTKVKGYIPARENIKAIGFTDIEAHTHTALTNAITSRQIAHAVNTELKMYQLNPYTTVDRLVFKLLYLPVHYEWILDSSEVLIPDFNIEVNFEYPTIYINMTNKSETIQIIQSDLVSIVNVKGESHPVLNRRMPEPEGIEKFTVNLIDFAALNPKYITFKIADQTYQITEIPLPIA